MPCAQRVRTVGQRDQESLLRACRRQHLGVRRSAQPVVVNGTDVMVVGRHQVSNRGRQVLVELDPHVMGSGKISSRESSAP